MAVYFNDERKYNLSSANQQVLQEASNNIKLIHSGVPFIALAFKK